ncbi:MAG: hypothetical protein ACREN3_04495 [Gemmatimonadaceae bacterium]
MSEQTRHLFRTRWTAKREAYAEAGALVDGVRLLDRVLADMEAVFSAEAAETLTLAEAAAETGYTRDHIARLIRTGTLPNAGRPRAPRVRRADLPRKPRSPSALVASSGGRAYDPRADARSLGARRGG